MKWMLITAAATPRLTLPWAVVLAVYAISILLVAGVVIRTWRTTPPPSIDIDEDAHEAIVARHRAAAPECAISNTDDAA